MNVYEFKKATYEFLKTINDNIYEGQKPPVTLYPYVVYNLDTSDTDDNQLMEVFELTIDIFDNNKLDSTTIDTIAGNIDGDGDLTSATGLHRRHHYEAGVVRADYYRIERNEDINNDIRHIELTYEVYVYLV